MMMIDVGGSLVMLSEIHTKQTQNKHTHTHTHTHDITTQKHGQKKQNTITHTYFYRRNTKTKQNKTNQTIMTDDNNNNSSISSLVLQAPGHRSPTTTTATTLQVSKQQSLVLPPKVMEVFLAWYTEYLFPTSTIPNEDHILDPRIMPSLVQVVNFGDGTDLMILLHHLLKNLGMSWYMIRLLLNKEINYHHLLHIAARRTDDSAGIVTENLLRYGARIESIDLIKGYTPLFTAVCASKNESVVKVLLRGGADFDGCMWRGDDRPILHKAATIEGTAPIVKVLLENGANIEINQLVNGRTPLVQAVMSHNYPVASLLLNSGADIQYWRDQRNQHRGESVMHLAVTWALTGSTLGEGVSIMRLLLEQECGGNIINLTDNRIQTPLHLAALLHDGNECKTEVIQLLLRHGANVHARDFMGCTVLHLLAIEQRSDTVALLEFLLDFGVDIHAQDLTGQTCLHLAAKGIDNFRAIPLLLEHAVKIGKTIVDIRDSRGRTVVHYLSMWFGLGRPPAHKRIVELVLTMSQDVNIVDKTGRTPLHCAVMAGNEWFVRALLSCGAVNALNAQDEHGRTPLVQAVMSNNYPVASLLLNSGADIQYWRDETNSRRGESMMHLAVAWALSSTLGEGVSILRLLLEQECGENIINGADDRKWTPLHVAALLHDGNECKTEVIQLLVAHGANVHARDFMGCTVLHLLVIEQRSDTVALLEFMLDFGVDIHAQDLAGETCLHYAAKGIDNFRAIPLLLEHAVKIGKTIVDIRDSRGRTVVHYLSMWFGLDRPLAHKRIVELVLTMSQDVNIVDKTGRTPLHCAVMAGNEWFVRALLSCGAVNALNVQDEHGRSPLDYAVRNWNLDIVKILLDKGAEINAKGELRRTALHLAAWANQSNMARLLMERGADPTSSDIVGMNPLDVALANRANGVVELLS